jgi:predicted adenine nucleotide alpha hydrolase (AANH) superfamily ATPase
MDVSLYFYNPNIWDFEEYSKRKSAAVKYAADLGLNFFEDESFVYDYESWRSLSLESCQNCYSLRLKKTAAFAKENGFDCFSTSLLSSPYQNASLIRESALEISKEIGIEFLEKDFKEFFYAAKNALRKEGFYIQKYCACAKSYRQRFGNAS